MKERIINGVVVTTNDPNMSDAEILAYINKTREAYITDYLTQEITALNIKVTADDVEISYTISLPKFERIRRITGYLVGTIDRWNNGKVSELRDRYKSINPEQKYTSADELVRMGEIQSIWNIELPDWMVNQYDVINNSSCACNNISRTA